MVFSLADAGPAAPPRPAPAGQPAFQTFAVPATDLTAGEPAFDSSRIRSIRFVFDRTRAGRVLLDDVGVRAVGLAGRA